MLKHTRIRREARRRARRSWRPPAGRNRTYTATASSPATSRRGTLADGAGQCRGRPDRRGADSWVAS